MSNGPLLITHNPLRRVLYAALTRFASWLQTLYEKIDEASLRFCKDPGVYETLHEIDDYTKSIEEFLGRPNEVADSVEREEYRGFVRQYFILKRAVALFEAYDRTLPLQLFNEMRNAFDHLVRSLIAPTSPTESRAEHQARNLSQVKRHLLRATLDAMKLICAFLDEDIVSLHARFSDKTIGLVNNGDYVKEVTRRHIAAKSLFIKAREEEFQLGSNDGDQNVFMCYLRAAVAFRNAHQYQSDNYGNLVWARFKRFAYVTLGVFGLFLAEFVAHFFKLSIIEWLIEQIHSFG